MEKLNAIILLSGGLDSATVLYMAKQQGFNLHALSFDYGQKHNIELESAKKIAKQAGVVSHKIVSLNLDLWGGSSLTDTAIEVENGEINSSDIPNTYVPARNMVFLSVAASYAEAIGAQHIFIGVSQVDYSGYVDCRQDFIDAMENAINLGTVAAVEHNKPIKIHVPLINMTKAEEIKTGMSLGVDYALTWSCYRGEEKPCGTCDSCLIRAKAFKEAGVVDPALNN